VSSLALQIRELNTKSFAESCKTLLSMMGFIRFATPCACRKRVSNCVNRGGKKRKRKTKNRKK
jgi:hypothetical protein